MMNQANIHSIFPVPIYTTRMDRAFTKKELQFVKEQKKHIYKSTGNFTTHDTYILDKKEFKNIKKFLEKCCKDYLEKIICSKNNISLYITQSWLNYTEESQYHHKHEHPNSVVSGVLYLDADVKNDKIVFSHPIRYQQIQVDVDRFNAWNSDSWYVPVKTGELFMFPSSLSHQVIVKKGNNTRISLAFNTFYKGTMGSKDRLFELKIK
jgi:uncharacterized protein (TIGR02466 family)|tara:strand:- start:98 stop:721 length:624 start_codon:yes stop_codon:yes gene_type:complete